MDVTQIFGVNVAIVAAVLSGLVQPAFAALLTRAPTALTGVLTTLQSAVAGFIAEWAAHAHHFNWRHALGATLASWVVALLAQNGWYKKTPLVLRLHARGPQFGGDALPEALPPARRK